MFWEVTAFPRCTHHAFLSHCAEDRNWLVGPVNERLKQRGIIPWLDQEDYYHGRSSRVALRDGLLHSRHAVFFITLGMMAYQRGWCALELAYGDLLQANFAYAGGETINYILPLFYLRRDDPLLPRCIWGALADKGQFHDGHADPIDWTVDRITEFLKREQLLAIDFSRVVVSPTRVHSELSRRNGLVERIVNFDPSAIP